MDKELIKIQTFATFSDIEPSVNPSFHKAKTRIMAIESIANRCNFSKDSVLKGLPTLKNVPIVTQYNDETGNLKGHEFDKNGNALTYAIGTIPESAEQWIEEVEENGETKQYLCSDVLLWKRQKKEFEFIQTHKELSVSMEVMITDSEFDKESNILNIDDFYFTAVTVLGIGITPAFGEANITFSQQDEQYQQMMFELNNFENGGNTMPPVQSKQFEEEQQPVEPQTTEPEQPQEPEQVQEQQPVEPEQQKEPEVDYKSLLEKEQVESGRTIRELTQERDVLTQQLEQLKQDQQKQMEDVMKELEDLRQYKHNIEKEQRQGQINAILDNFKDLEELEDYQALIKDVDNLTPQQLEDKCYVIAGKQARAKRQRNTSTPPKINITTQHKETPKKDDRYGGLLFK